MKPDWLGNMPSSWSSVPFGSVFTQSKRKNSMLQRDFVLSVIKDRGVIPYTEKGNVGNKVSDDLSGYKLVDKGDFVLNSMNLYMGSVGVSDYDGVTSTAYIVCKPSENVYAGYYNYLIQFKGFQEYVGLLGKGIMEIREAVRWTALKSVFVPLPDLETQRQIADFLDCETARIDLLIEKKQRLVVLLAERLEELIEERLASVPQSKVHRLKFAIRKIEQGWSPQCEDIRVEGNRWGVLKLGAITTGAYLEEHHKALPIGVDPIAPLKVKSGDVLVARASGSPKLVGKAAYVKKTNLNLMLSDKHFRLVPNPKKARPEYLATVVNSRASRRQIEDRLSSAEGMARNIGQNVIYGLKCPFPSLDEQDAILAKIRSWQEETAHLSDKTNASIDRLKEYRSALITAAVTGQIDVASPSRSDASESRLNAPREEMDA